MLIIYKNLTIRNATKDDAIILSNWWNDGKVMAHAGFPKGLGTTPNEVELELSRDSDDVYRRLMIECEDIPIGEMNYRNTWNGIAEIGIKICDFSKQERGFGKILLSMLINSLFEDMGYSKIILDTNLNNLRAQHVYEELGFKKLRVNIDSWRNQLGELQSSIDYEMNKDDFINFAGNYYLT